MTHTSTEQERAEFQEWALSKWPLMDVRTRSQDGNYADFETRTRFMAWQEAAARRAPVVPQRCDLCKNNGGYFYGRTGYEPCCVGSLAPQPPEVKGSVSNVTLAEPVQMPENIREGEPYDNPAFEALARALGVWGTAQSAACAQFWIAAKEQST